MSKSKFKYEYLPKRIVKNLNDLTNCNREYRTFNNYLLIIGSIYLHQMRDDASYYSYSPLSREYWRSVIGSHYNHFINRLLSVKIIQRKEVQYVDDFGNVSNVNGYRINPDLLSDDFTLIKYKGEYSKSKSAEIVNGKIDDNHPITKLNIKPYQIQLQKVQAHEWIKSNIGDVFNNYLNNQYITGLPQTLSVLVRIYSDGNSFNAKYMSIEAAHKLANDRGVQLLYYKDRFVIAELEQFKSIAKTNLTNYYKWMVNSFKPDSFNFSRNTNTLRVYSKLTSLPTSLLPFIRINEQYISQADLKCSQFTLFANLINFYLNHSGEELIGLFKKQSVKTFVKNLVSIFDKHKNVLPDFGLNSSNPVEDIHETNDVYTFLVDSLQNDFYKIIKNGLGLELREHGKAIAFRTVFSKPKPENVLVKKFRELYPTVIEIINDFKNKYEYNQFAIGLQRVEAAIFIDHIWDKVKKAGIDCFTRHDSIVFPINKKKEVDQIITDVFTSFDFLYTIKYEEFNTDEIMQRVIENTDYVDTMEEADEADLFALNQAEQDKIEERISDFLEQLSNIELPEQKSQDYFECVTLDTLSEIMELEELSPEKVTSLENDSANLLSNYPVPQFQDETNKLISWLIDIKNGDTDFIPFHEKNRPDYIRINQ